MGIGPVIRRTGRWTWRSFAIFMLVYAGLTALPISVWFEPGQPTFTDVVEGEDPFLVYRRDIKLRSHISYRVVVRRVDSSEPWCHGEDPGFEYQPTNGPGEVFERHLFSWWMPQANNCWRPLTPGSYWVRTTWTIKDPMRALLPEILDDPLGWMLPDKQITIDSPPFEVREKIEAEVAE